TRRNRTPGAIVTHEGKELAIKSTSAVPSRITASSGLPSGLRSQFALRKLPKNELQTTACRPWRRRSRRVIHSRSGKVALAPPEPASGKSPDARSDLPPSLPTRSLQQAFLLPRSLFQRLHAGPFLMEGSKAPPVPPPQ